MLILYVRMVFDKFQEAISLRQSKRLEKYINCNTRKKSRCTGFRKRLLQITQ